MLTGLHWGQVKGPEVDYHAISGVHAIQDAIQEAIQLHTTVHVHVVTAEIDPADGVFAVKNCACSVYI